MKLTVKASSNKLREATRAATGNASKAAAPKDPFIGGQVLEGKRSRNVTKSYVMESDSEEDVEMDDVVDDEDAEGESIDEDEDEDAEDDGLGDEDAEGDIEMDIPPPPPPVIKISKAQSGKQSIVVKPPPKVDNKTVEQKEVEDGSDDEELSDLSDLEEDDVEEEEAMQSDNEEDAEGEDEDIEDVEDGDEPLDSDDETPMDGSRASTPDLSKLTRRQRAKFEEDTVHLMALPDGKHSHSCFRPLILTLLLEVQVKKHFTAEEHAMRRAEMARRRKNLSEKRNEEEKVLFSSSPILCLLTHVIYITKLTMTNRWKQSTSSSKNKPPRPMPAARSSTSSPANPLPTSKPSSQTRHSCDGSATRTGTSSGSPKSG